MKYQRSSFIQKTFKKVIKSTQFWQDNPFLLRGLGKLRWMLTFAMAYSISAALMAGLSVGLTGAFLQGLTSPNDPPIQTGIEMIDIWFLASKATGIERLLRIGILILLITWLQAVLQYFGLLYSRLTAINLVDQIRKSLFEQLQRLSLKYFLSSRSGNLANSLTTEVNQISQAFGYLSLTFTQGLLLVGYAISMILISWQLFFASILVFSFLLRAVSVIRSRVREASFSVPTANAKFASVSLEFINGIRTVHASATQDFERKRFYSAATEIRQANIRLSGRQVLTQPLIQGIASTLLIILLLGAFTFLVANGKLQASSLLAFLFALSRALPLISQISTSQVNFTGLQGSLYNVNELLRQDDKPYLQDGTATFPGLKQSIEFVSVGFGYDDNQAVLRDIDVSIQRSQTTAFVGSSGAGKTTLVDLVPRFFDPSSGQILIDGVDLREFRINTLRQKMAIVSQDTFIFNASVRYNIAYGFEGINDNDLWRAAELANALDFIKSMPDGFETQLGDRGVRLSGGQRQRIAIARAILRNPEILILDEATSALDSVTERLIQDSLENLSVGRTVIVIAHRLSTIVRADKVVVMEQGKVIEQGKYQELLERRSKLWEYHQMQFGRSSIQDDN